MSGISNYPKTKRTKHPAYRLGQMMETFHRQRTDKPSRSVRVPNAHREKALGLVKRVNALARIARSMQRLRERLGW